MRFMRGMVRCHLLLFLLAGGPELDEVLRALQLLVIGFQLGQHREIPCFGICKVAAEDDRHRLTAPHMIAEHDRNLPDDAANQRSDMHLVVLIRVDDSRNTKCAGSLLYIYMDGLNLRLLEIVGTKLDL